MASAYKAGDKDADGGRKPDWFGNPPALGGLEPELRGSPTGKIGADLLPPRSTGRSEASPLVGKEAELASVSTLERLPSAKR